MVPHIHINIPHADPITLAREPMHVHHSPESPTKTANQQPTNSQQGEEEGELQKHRPSAMASSRDQPIDLTGPGEDDHNPKKRATKPSKKKATTKVPKTPHFTSSHGGHSLSYYIHFEVVGCPRVKKRPGYRINHRYNASAALEKDFATAAVDCFQLHNIAFPKFGPGQLLEARVICYFPHTATVMPPLINLISKGDTDNYYKFVVDALNNVFYQDDKQIIQHFAKKTFDAEPGTKGRVEVTLSLLDEDGLSRIALPSV